MKKEVEVRIYGNQHGHWAVLSGKLAKKVDRFCKAHDITPEELLRRAVDEYFEKMEAVVILELEHQERMSGKADIRTKEA